MKWRDANNPPKNTDEVLLKIECNAQSSTVISGFYNSRNDLYCITYNGCSLEVSEVLGWCKIPKGLKL